MHGLHLKQRGRWWHYYRNRPRRYENVEPRKIITFALRTTCISEAKCEAVKISRELDKKWESALLRGLSLANDNQELQYIAAKEATLAHGFHPSPAQSITDADLLNRLRFLVMGHHGTNEDRAILGLVAKPQLSLNAAFDKFWAHIEDEWTGLSHDCDPSLRYHRNWQYVIPLRTKQKTQRTIN